MTETLPFQRARKPEEREVRREAILAAAAELFDAEGAQGAGLNAIAARAGFTKSNVYRYFESREEVLLSLFTEEFARFVDAFEPVVAACPEGDAAAIAHVTATAFIARPRLCQLIAILSSVLEQNVSAETIIALKRTMNANFIRVAAAIHARLPDTTIKDCAWAGSMVGTLVAGMWPGAHPAPAAELVLKMPEFAHLKPDLDRDLERATLALLDSIVKR
jgi:TetR/AcrR family transcriptional regulator